MVVSTLESLLFCEGCCMKREVRHSESCAKKWRSVHRRRLEMGKDLDLLKRLLIERGVILGSWMTNQSIVHGHMNYVRIEVRSIPARQ